MITLGLLQRLFVWENPNRENPNNKPAALMFGNRKVSELNDDDLRLLVIGAGDLTKSLERLMFRDYLRSLPMLEKTAYLVAGIENRYIVDFSRLRRLVEEFGLHYVALEESVSLLEESLPTDQQVDQGIYMWLCYED